MRTPELPRFVEKYHVARDAALQSYFNGGTTGIELEWNIVDAQFRPVGTVTSGGETSSFAEMLRTRYVPEPLHAHSELEVFQWMTEWITQPYYHPLGAVYESRVLEGVVLNALSAASLSLGQSLMAWTGNMLSPVEVGRDAIPPEWTLTKRRYLERCVELYGDMLSTAGVHSNVSLPEPLLSLDFLHLPEQQREGNLIAYRTGTYIRGARLLRGFAALTMALSASSPLRAERRGDEPVILLTERDSNRLLQFPNPEAMDVPDLYRSHADYVRISNDLVQRRIRFGNNNWTPVRARSDTSSVHHIINLTTDQLHQVYLKGIYDIGKEDAAEQTAQQIERENLLARIALPMTRVEVRCDEGGHPLALDVANLTFKQLLLCLSYADRELTDSFRYDAADIERLRRNERAAAEHGMRGEIEHPFTGKTVKMRDFLKWALEQVKPLADALEWTEYLEPLAAIAGGAPNTAEQLRAQLAPQVDSDGVVPLPALHALAEQRRQQIAHDVGEIIERVEDLGSEAAKLHELITSAATSAAEDPSAPVRFEPRMPHSATAIEHDTTAEIVQLSQQLVRIPSVTNCPVERIHEVDRCARFIAGFLRDAGVPVRFFDRGKYPSLLAHFPGQLTAPVMLSGHFDVVEPSPDDSQFNPVIEGNYLWGRGSADMKTVVATYLVWMRDMVRKHPDPFPPINLMLIGNEENGEGEPMGTPHILDQLQTEYDYAPELLIAGERTGEKGDELFGEICIENRGVLRVEFVAHGEQTHTGVTGAAADLGAKILQARDDVNALLKQRLTLAADDGWKTDYRFPFVSVGKPGVYNITAASGHLGLEIRPIPEDDVISLLDELRHYAEAQDMELRLQTKEPGVACDRDNPHLLTLIDAVRDVSGEAPQIGRKKPGTSGRFAPRGQAVIWGQTGIGPHTPNERHYIPSIAGYYDALNRYAELLTERVVT